MDKVSETEQAKIKNIDQDEIYPYSLMFSPLEIEDLKLNNRIFWAPPVEVGTIQAITDPPPELSAFLRERAAAGLSLAFVGQADSSADKWGALAKELNQLGCRLAVGISPPVLGKKMGTRRLNRLTDEMKESVKELYAAGVDAIYLDAVPGTYLGWLLARQDEYLSFYYKTGAHYLFHFTTQIRQALPAGFPLFLRAAPINIGMTMLQNFKNIGLNGVLFQADDSFNGTIESSKALRSALSEGNNRFYVFAEMPAIRPQPSACEHVLLDDAADAVVLSRALLAEADWPALSYSGREARQNNCILCRGGCTPSFFPGSIPGCAVNPRTGKELIYPQNLPPVYPCTRLAVIGAGPAGMQAALTAWERGFEVSLFDKEENPLAQYMRQQGEPTHLHDGMTIAAPIADPVQSAEMSSALYKETDNNYLTFPDDSDIELSVDSDKVLSADSDKELSDDSDRDLTLETTSKLSSETGDNTPTQPSKEDEASIAYGMEISQSADENDSAMVSGHDEDGEAFKESVSKLTSRDPHAADVAEIENGSVNLSELTIGEAKLASEKRINDLPDGKAVNKDAVLEFMSQKSSLPNEDTIINSEVSIIEEESEQSQEPLHDEQIIEQLLSVSATNGLTVEEEREIAWHRHCYLIMAKLHQAEDSGDFLSYFQTEVTLAMLAQNRFDIVIVATGSENGYDIFYLIQNSYVTPQVRVAGAAAGSKGLTEAIRSGYAVAASLY